jgi:hypothetical protein
VDAGLRIYLARIKHARLPLVRLGYLAGMRLGYLSDTFETTRVSYYLHLSGRHAPLTYMQVLAAQATYTVLPQS